MVEMSKLLISGKFQIGEMGNPDPPIADWIDLANKSGHPILSLDSLCWPDTTTGVPSSPCIHASSTLTLALSKTGLVGRAPTCTSSIISLAAYWMKHDWDGKRLTLPVT